MIISCPACATRYDIDDDRFHPDGRSVRCAACGESWFVPAPGPIEDLIAPRRKSQARDEDEGEARAPRRAREEARADRRPDRDDADAKQEDDALFARAERSPSRDRGEARDERDRGRQDRGRQDRGRHEDDDDQRRFGRDDEDEKPRGGFWKGRGDRQEPDLGAGDEDDKADRGFWWRKGKRQSRDEVEDQLFSRPYARNHRDDRDRDDDRRYDDGPRFSDDDDDRDSYRNEPREATIVDADFEDIEGEDEFGADRGFGRRARAERRRATALARLDDLDPVAERVFSDEFFAALHVQPKELERALRKARRRAEARDKNRMTPLRALGWSAWIGLVAATGFVGYAYRDDIVARWPNTAGAYAIVGIDAAPHGLKIESVTHRLAMSTSGPTIEITGSLKNEGEEALTPPLMQAEALGAKGELLSRWTFTVDADSVAEGALAPFTTRAPAPEGVVEVALSFAPEKTGGPGINDLLKRQN